jgi:ABC-type hemin transport system ATPase subunit
VINLGYVALGLESAESALSRLTADLDEAQQQLRAPDAVGTVRERMAAELEVARWQGALEMMSEPTESEEEGESIPLKVLDTAAKVLDQESKTAAADLFAELNTEIVNLGRCFGMSALEAVEVNRAAQLKVVKGGGAQSFFSKQSPGEQLRLRIAVVIALLRVGHRLGISTHPGLVLIDSPKAEEIQDFDAAVVFRQLAQLATTDHAQVLITTSDFALSRAVLPAESVVAAEEGALLW